jgi:hypothetical protein
MHIGSKYAWAHEHSTAEIAAAFRADVKEAIKNGILPRLLKLKVQTRTFAGGSAIDVLVIRTGFNVVNPEWLAAFKAGQSHKGQHEIFNQKARDLVAALSTMLNEYNRRDVDSPVRPLRRSVLRPRDHRQRTAQRRGHREAVQGKLPLTIDSDVVRWTQDRRQS